MVANLPSSQAESINQVCAVKHVLAVPTHKSGHTQTKDDSQGEKSHGHQTLQVGPAQTAMARTWPCRLGEVLREEVVTTLATLKQQHLLCSSTTPSSTTPPLYLQTVVNTRNVMTQAKQVNRAGHNSWHKIKDEGLPGVGTSISACRSNRLFLSAKCHFDLQGNCA